MKFLVKVLLIPLGLFVFYVGIIIYNQFFYIMGATQGQPMERNTRPHSALLVIDIQQSLPTTIPGVEEFIDHTNRAIDHVRERDGKVIFVTQIKEKQSLRSFFLPHIAAEDSPMAALHSGLHTGEPQVFTKLRADAFSNPDFEQYFHEEKVGKVYITGMAAEVCVDYTIQGALNRGYEVYVISDAVLAMFGEGSKQKRLDKYSKLGAKLITLEEFLQQH